MNEELFILYCQSESLKEKNISSHHYGDQRFFLGSLPLSHSL